jgi:hypothetical protein
VAHDVPNCITRSYSVGRQIQYSSDRSVYRLRQARAKSRASNFWEWTQESAGANRRTLSEWNFQRIITPL